MPTLNEAIDKFLLLKTASMRSDATIKWYQSVLGAMVAELGIERDVKSIIEDDALEYIAGLRKRNTRYLDAPQKPQQSGGLARASIASHVRALKAFWQWAEKRYDMKNPMWSIQIPKAMNRKPKGIDPNDFVKLFNAVNDETCKCPHRERAILALLADSGVRRGGLVSLTTEIDTARRVGKVIEKGFKERLISWTHFTSELLDKWLAVREADGNNALFVSMNDGQPLQVSAINQILKRLKKKAGVDGRVNPHAFRHNFARMYLMSGGDLSTLADILGHSSTNTTSSYYAVFTQDELTKLQEEHSPLLNMLDNR